MAKRHYLSLLFRNHSENLIYEVREQHTERLRSILNSDAINSDNSSFFWFSTVDGKSVCINLEHTQSIHFLWDHSPLPPDTTRHEGPVAICLRDHSKQIEIFTESPDQLFDLFCQLESGQPNRFSGLEDEDGELLLLNTNELVWITAPTHLISDGERIVIEESD